MKDSSPRARAMRTRASLASNSMREEVLIRIRLEALRKLVSPPNSTPTTAAIRIRLDEAKNEAEFRAWPIRLASISRCSPVAMLRIHQERMHPLLVDAQHGHGRAAADGRQPDGPRPELGLVLR